RARGAGDVRDRQPDQGCRWPGHPGAQSRARPGRAHRTSRPGALPVLTDTTSALLPVYATFPLRAASGHGSWLVDEDGQEWLDAYGGHAVATCGHSHPDVVRAIADQAARLLFYSTAVPHAGRERLADALIARAP